MGKENGFDVWSLTSPDGRSRAVFVPQLGGIGASLVLPGPEGPRELLYQHPFFWERGRADIRGGWPFLFPVCGRLELEGEPDAYRWEGQGYFLPIHGFAARLAWQLVDTGHANELVLELFNGESTRVRYPFAFRLGLKYRLENDRLQCRLSVRNESARDMPYYAGFHPYFRTPPPGEGKERVQVAFSAIRRLTYNASLSDVVGEAPPPRTPLSAADPHASEMLVKLGADKEVRLRYPDGLTIHMDARGVENPDLFPYLQLYTMPDRPFFCAEHWMGFPNMLNRAGEVHRLPPGGAEHAVVTVRTSW